MSKQIAGLPVVSTARKVVFALSAGRISSFPEGVTPNEYGQNNEQPVIVVKNGTDNSWQGADADGFIIVNEVPETIAKKALKMVRPSLLRARSHNDRVRQALRFLNASGYVDQYTTNQGFYDSKLSFAGYNDGRSGIMKRDDRDITHVFFDQNGELRIQISDGGIRDIKFDILKRTYRNADGSPITSISTIPQQEILEDQLLAQ